MGSSRYSSQPGSDASLPQLTAEHVSRLIAVLDEGGPDQTELSSRLTPHLVAKLTPEQTRWLAKQLRGRGWGEERIASLLYGASVDTPAAPRDSRRREADEESASSVRLPCPKGHYHHYPVTPGFKGELRCPSCESRRGRRRASFLAAAELRFIGYERKRVFTGELLTPFHTSLRLAYVDADVSQRRVLDVPVHQLTARKIVLQEGERFSVIAARKWLRPAEACLLVNHDRRRAWRLP